MPARPARFAALRARLADRLARSSRVFLLGVIAACGIEVFVDWNATIFEINVLRDGMRQRGQSYVRILLRAADQPLRTGDRAALDSLSAGVFEDEDVAYVRFADPQSALVHDRLRPGLDDGRAPGQAFRERYARQLNRDVTGVLQDPEGLAGRMARSRHRDFVQAWNDAVEGLLRRLLRRTQKALPEGPLVLYQDRLRLAAGGHDPDTTYALGVVGGRAAPRGVVLVAFSMARTNAAIRQKYAKGLGMVIFFVGLILVQNILSRRDKLRLLELESKQRVAKEAVRAALPAALRAGSLCVGASLLQAEGPVDGVLWCVRSDGDRLTLLVVDPDGEGVSAAATALHVTRVFGEMSPRQELLEEAALLGAAALAIPLTRPVGIWLARLDLKSGALRALSSPLGGAAILSGATGRVLSAPLGGAEVPALPAGISGPLTEVRAEVPAGGLLCAVFAGEGRRGAGRERDTRAVCDYVARSGKQPLDPAQAEELAGDAVTWAKGRSGELRKGDILVMIVARS